MTVTSNPSAAMKPAHSKAMYEAPTTKVLPGACSKNIEEQLLVLAKGPHSLTLLLREVPKIIRALILQGCGDHRPNLGLHVAVATTTCEEIRIVQGGHRKVDVRRRGDGLEGVGDVVATAATAEAPPFKRANSA